MRFLLFFKFEVTRKLFLNPPLVDFYLIAFYATRLYIYCIPKIYFFLLFFLASTPDKAAWSEWSEWSTCSASCGGGARERQRQCMNHGPMSPPCQGHRTEEVTCNTEKCAPGK